MKQSVFSKTELLTLISVWIWKPPGYTHNAIKIMGSKIFFWKILKHYSKKIYLYFFFLSMKLFMIWVLLKFLDFQKFHVLFLLQNWILHAHPTGAPFTRSGPGDCTKIWGGQLYRPPSRLSGWSKPFLLNLGKSGGPWPLRPLGYAGPMDCKCSKT